ncbi:MAG: glycosyltransferase [Pseudomonadota bacterium]|nr:glycosyltransferase [Pseudomonadota bacterium]
MTSVATTAKTMPRLSIVVIFYNMAREAPRTLYSLSAAYQRDVSASDYEVIAIDNGSKQPLDAALTAQVGTNFSHIRIDNASPSPAAAINLGVARSRGAHVSIMIDGARMASPGIVRAALDCLERFDRAIVGTIGFHLGSESQTKSVNKGYNQQVEDKLLDSVDWRKNGYALYGIAALAGSSATAWLGTISESNFIFMPRAVYDELGGYDERFSEPGGGLVNLDFYKRAVELPGSTLLTLLGEATFHQFHGGTMTNRRQEEVPDELARYRAQYEQIRGVPYVKPGRMATLYGSVRAEALPWLKRASAVMMTAVPGSHAIRMAAASAPGSASPAAPAPSPAPAPAADLKPGDEHYRAYVGRAENYDRMSAVQFSLLAMLGLRDNHRLLDLGCGSLRGGRLFIPYLLPGNYFGIEPNKWLVDGAISDELGKDLIALKKPQFSHNDDFNLEVFSTDFDFMLAQSIFSHTGITQLRRCLQSASRALKPDGLLVATIVERYEDQYQDEWVYPGLNHFSWATITSICAEYGLVACKLDWPHRLQTWIGVARSPERLKQIPAQGVDLLPDELILTGDRFLAGKAGKFYGFFRHALGKAVSRADRKVPPPSGS